MAQTTIQDPKAVRFGSGVVEIGDTLETLVNIGGCNNVHFIHEFDKNEITIDNTGIFDGKVANQRAILEADLAEITVETLGQYLSGVAEVEIIGGAPQTVTAEEHTLRGNLFVRLNHKNSDGTMVASVVVRDKTSGTTAVLDTDYQLGVDADGYTVIGRIAASTVIADGAVVEVDYQYTPAASKRLHVGGRTTLNAMIVRITNYNSDGEPLSITIYKATADQGIDIEFLADDSDEVNVCPIRIVGTDDTTRQRGRQLFVIDDQQTD